MPTSPSPVPGQLTFDGKRQTALGEFCGLEVEADPPEPLTDGEQCFLCGAGFEDPQHNPSKHVLTEHPTEVLEYLDVLKATRARRNGHRGNGQAGPSGTDGGSEDERFRVNPDGPVAFGQAPTERVGQGWGGGVADPRQCDVGGPDCLGRMSKGYARVFARDHDGFLSCPACLPRSARYSGDGGVYGTDHVSHPGTVLGSKNPRAQKVGDRPADD